MPMLTSNRAQVCDTVRGGAMKHSSHSRYGSRQPVPVFWNAKQRRHKSWYAAASSRVHDQHSSAAGLACKMWDTAVEQWV